jgi:hypothetical protein
MQLRRQWNDPAEFVDGVTRRSKRKTSNRLRKIMYTSPSNMTYIYEDMDALENLGLWRMHYLAVKAILTSLSLRKYNRHGLIADLDISGNHFCKCDRVYSGLDACPNYHWR